MSGLVLRDVHVPPAPPWWPPAPGWWVAVGIMALLALAWMLRGRYRMTRRRRAIAWFDARLAEAASPTERLATASELLRRAARGRRAGADRLDGEAWLAFLDEGDGAFRTGPGRLLLDGPFRAAVDAAEADAALALARARFASLRGAA
jgi:hypothetical protein